MALPDDDEEDGVRMRMKELLTRLFVHDNESFLNVYHYFSQNEKLFDAFIHLERILDIDKLVLVFGMLDSLNKAKHNKDTHHQDKKKIEDLAEPLYKKINSELIIKKINELLFSESTAYQSIYLMSLLDILLRMDNGLSLVLEKHYGHGGRCDLTQALWRYKQSYLQKFFNKIAKLLTFEQFIQLLNNDQNNNILSSLLMALNVLPNDELIRLVGGIFTNCPLILQSPLEPYLKMQRQALYPKLLMVLSEQDVINQELIALTIVMRGALSQEVLKTELSKDWGKRLCSKLDIDSDNPAVLDNFQAALIQKISDKLYDLIANDGPVLDYLNAIADFGLNALFWNAPSGDQGWSQLDRLANTPHVDVALFLKKHRIGFGYFKGENQKIKHLSHSASFFEKLPILDEETQIFYLMLLDNNQETRLMVLVRQEVSAARIHELKMFLALIKSYQEISQFNILYHRNVQGQIALELTKNTRVTDVGSMKNILVQAISSALPDEMKLPIFLKRIDERKKGYKVLITQLPQTIRLRIDGLITNQDSGVLGSENNLLMRLINSDIPFRALVDIMLYIKNKHADLILKLALIIDDKGNNLLMRFIINAKNYDWMSTPHVSECIIPLFLGKNNEALEQVNALGYTPLMIGIAHQFQYLSLIIDQYKKLPDQKQLRLYDRTGKDGETVLSLYEQFQAPEQSSLHPQKRTLGNYVAYIQALQKKVGEWLTEYDRNPEAFKKEFPSLFPKDGTTASGIVAAVTSFGLFAADTSPSSSSSSSSSVAFERVNEKVVDDSDNARAASSSPVSPLSRKRGEPEFGHDEDDIRYKQHRQ